MRLQSKMHSCCKKQVRRKVGLSLLILCYIIEFMTRREARDFVASHNWRFAKTMQKWPHWYVVRKYCRSDDEWLAFVRLIRRWGYDEKFFNSKIRYLDLDGYKYWTNGYVEEDTDVINRAVLKNDDEHIPWIRNEAQMTLKRWPKGEAIKAGGIHYLNSENHKPKAIRVRVKVRI